MSFSIWAYPERKQRNESASVRRDTKKAPVKSRSLWCETASVNVIKVQIWQPAKQSITYNNPKMGLALVWWCVVLLSVAIGSGKFAAEGRAVSEPKRINSQYPSTFSLFFRLRRRCVFVCRRFP